MASHLPAHPYHDIPMWEDAPGPGSEYPLYLPAEETLSPTLSFCTDHNSLVLLQLF